MGRQPELLAAWPAGCQADTSFQHPLGPGSLDIFETFETFEVRDGQIAMCWQSQVTLAFPDIPSIPSISASFSDLVTQPSLPGLKGHSRWLARTVRAWRTGYHPMVELKFKMHHNGAPRCVGLAVVQAPTVEKCRISCTNKPRCKFFFIAWSGLNRA